MWGGEEGGQWFNGTWFGMGFRWRWLIVAHEYKFRFPLRQRPDTTVPGTSEIKKKIKNTTGKTSGHNDMKKGGHVPRHGLKNLRRERNSCPCAKINHSKRKTVVSGVLQSRAIFSRSRGTPDTDGKKLMKSYVPYVFPDFRHC